MSGVTVMSEDARQRNEAPIAPATGPAADGVATDPALAQIREALRGLRFGVVSIVVQDGVVIQIERTERRRLR